MNKASCTMLAFIFLFIPSRLEDKLSNDVEVLMLQSFAWDRRSAFYTWVWEIGALEYRLHFVDKSVFDTPVYAIATESYRSVYQDSSSRGKSFFALYCTSV